MRQRQRAFGAKWRAQEPEPVATLERIFGARLAYLETLERGERWEAPYLRTISAWERVDRALRQKARQVGAFHREVGLLVA